MALSFNSGHPLAGNVTHLIAVDSAALVEVKAGALSFTVDPDASFGTGTYGAHFRTAGVGFTPDGASWTPAIPCNTAGSGWTLFIVVNAVTQIWGGQGGILITDGSYAPNIKIDPVVPGQGNNTGYGTGTLSMSGGAGSIAMTRAAADASTTIAYKNGSVSVSTTAGFSNSGGTLTGIGGNGAGAAINLDMVYLVVFNRVLTGTEISDLHATLGASNTFGLLGAADSTPPTLTSPTATATTPTSASGSVSTNEANGTLYRYASTNATESVATVKASGSTSTVTASGTQSVTFTGLTPATTYFAHYVHTDAASNDSARVTSASFATPAIATLTSSPLKNNTGTLLLSAPFECYCNHVSTGALVLKKTGLTSHASTGVVTFQDAALTTGVEVAVRWRETTTGAEGYERLTPT